jgi:murein DD-endopeptidase MepM/ murein hydrolase activator NlpD
MTTDPSPGGRPVALLLSFIMLLLPPHPADHDREPGACYPTAGEITGHMGEPRPGGRAHAGIDIKAPRGTSIHAVFAGKVTDIRYEPGMGGVVVELTHAEGYRTKYMHMFDPGMGWDPGLEHLPLPVRVGEWVDACDVIGYVGSSGLSRFPHLHLSYVPPSGFNLDPAAIPWEQYPETFLFRWWDADLPAGAPH